MMRRQILLWIGLSVLFASWCLCRDGQASAVYLVRQGDTLSDISERLGATPDALRSANHLTKSSIKPGQIPVIPVLSVSLTKSQRSSSLDERAYEVKKGDTRAKIAMSFLLWSIRGKEGGGSCLSDLSISLAW